MAAILPLLVDSPSADILFCVENIQESSFQIPGLKIRTKRNFLKMKTMLSHQARLAVLAIKQLLTTECMEE